MKLTLIAIILALAIFTAASIFSRNPEIDALEKRYYHLEVQFRRLESRYDELQAKCEGVIAEVREIVTMEFSHVIPVAGGYFVGVRE